jgi:hypothetical protein
MGVPDRGDLRDCDRAGGLGVGRRLSLASEEPAPGSWSHGPPVFGQGEPELRGLARPNLSSQVDATVVPGTLGFDQPTSQVSIGRRTVPARRATHLSLLCLVGFLFPVPVGAQSPAGGAGPDRSTRPAYGYPQINGGTYGAYPQSGGDEPRFDYVVPTPDDVWNPDRAVVPPPGYTGYANPDAPDDRGFPGAGSPPPAFSGGGGPNRGAHPGSGVRPGGEGFRFRGDKAVSEGRWLESPSAPGYRFRPVSPEELERSTGGDSWRPIRRDDPRAAERGDSAPPDAFGYQPDSWFRRYYGERP